MSSTTTPTDWSDLYTALLQDMRTNTGVTTTTNLAKRYVDSGHHDLYKGHGEKFHWAERRAFIKTHAEYTDGTLSTTVGSGTITGSSTLWNTNNDHGQPNMRAGGRIVISGDSSVVYNVTAVASDTSATISPEYIGDTDSGLDYRYFEDEYALATDFLKPIDQQSFSDDGSIKLIGRSRFRQLYPRNWTTSTSISCAIIQDEPPSANTTPVRKIRFGPPPSDTQVIPYSYVTRYYVVASDGTLKQSFTADADEPIMPLRYRDLILLAAKAAWYRDLKDDSRAQSVLQELGAKFQLMLGDTDTGAQTLQWQSPLAGYRARAKRPYRNAGQRFDLHNRFDRLED